MIINVNPNDYKIAFHTNEIGRRRRGRFFFDKVSALEDYRMDSDANAQRARIEANGGTVTDISFLSNFIIDLKAGPGDCYSLLDTLYIPIAIKKDGSNFVSRIYDLSRPKGGGVYYDAVQNTGALQQTWQSNQINNKPWITFNPAKGGYIATGVASVAQPVTGFVICRKDGGGTTARRILGSGAVPQSLAYYDADTTSFAIYAGASALNAVSTQTTVGQFTCLMNGVLSNIRRKGTSLGTGSSGTSVHDTYAVGSEVDGTSLVHSGPIAFLAVARQAITTAQRDYIEGLLNNTYYQSTV